MPSVSGSLTKQRHRLRRSRFYGSLCRRYRSSHIDRSSSSLIGQNQNQTQRSPKSPGYLHLDFPVSFHSNFPYRHSISHQITSSPLLQSHRNTTTHSSTMPSSPPPNSSSSRHPSSPSLKYKVTINPHGGVSVRGNPHYQEKAQQEDSPSPPKPVPALHGSLKLPYARNPR